MVLRREHGLCYHLQILHRGGGAISFQELLLDPTKYSLYIQRPKQASRKKKCKTEYRDLETMLLSINSYN